MNNDTTTSLQMPEDATKDVLAEILRDGARKILSQAIEAEAAGYIAAHAHERDADGHGLVVRNGYASERELQTGLGALAVKQPRVNDKRADDAGNRFHFTSQILPPYLRKTDAPGAREGTQEIASSIPEGSGYCGLHHGLREDRHPVRRAAGPERCRRRVGETKAASPHFSPRFCHEDTKAPR